MRYVVLLVAVLCAACTANNPDAGTGVPELDTTETGIATGAVIGAGLGALVGSTAGEAGAGVVLGSIAGATSGGLIGKSIESQEKRIDQHDARAGINTKANNSSARSSLSETIWASSPSTSQNNRPSGTKGIAAKYVEPANTKSAAYRQNDDVIQVRQERGSVPSTPKTVSSSSAKSTYSYKERSVSSDLPPAVTPSIELQKPKAELPAYKGDSIPSRKPSFSDSENIKSSATSDLALQQSARSKLKDTQKRVDSQSLGADAFAPAKVSSTKSTQEKSTVSKSTLAKSEDKNEMRAKNTVSKNVDTAPIENKQKVVATSVDSLADKGQVKDTTTSTVLPEAKTIRVEEKAAVAKAAAPQVKAAATCEAGAKDYDRAVNASSDSDKVFYLRRVILSCPKDASARLQLGKVYSKLGLKDEAKKEFNAVLDNDPSNESAQDEMSIMMLDSRKN